MRAFVGDGHSKWLIPLLVVLGTTRLQAQAVRNDFRQGANDETNGPVTGLGNVHWISSILQPGNSEYFEGMVVPQRLLLSDIPASPTNTYHLLLRQQTTKAGVHAYDLLASWDQAVGTAASNGISTKLNVCGPEAQGAFGTTCDTLLSGGLS